MVRNYKPPLGTRNYANYSPHLLEEAVQRIVSGKMNQREASRKYGISRSTLQNKVKLAQRNVPGKPYGGQTAIAATEENIFESCLLAIADYGFPLTNFELRLMIKFHLDRQNKSVLKFKNNMPGCEWARLFLKRHKQLSERLAGNIKRARAKVSPEIIEEYCSNLKTTLEGVPPQNIWNYDETNLTDDPGSKKVICRRGSKYPERIITTSKSATSIMICGNAMGELLPPYVVYKATCMWNSWAEGGPTGAVYNRTPSGWFNKETFEDWFVKIALPRLKQQDQQKVLIGDNLSSHFTPTVIQLCEKYQIKFVSLPANSTHLTQPLDVAFFRPMKAMWRKILEEVKLATSQTVVAKDRFPRLLKKLMTELEPKGNSLKAGFKKCGIVPCSAEPIISRMPANVQRQENTANNSMESVNSSVLEYLSKSRYGDKEDTPNRPRKKVNIVPGKGVTEEDIARIEQERDQRQRGKKKPKRKNQEESAESEIDDDVENNPRPKKKKKKKGKVVIEEDSEDSEEEEEVHSIYDEEEEEAHFPYQVDSYVIVEYEGEVFPGQVLNVDVDGSAEVKTMTMRGTDWAWPAKDDQCWYEKEFIKEVIQPPKPRASKSSMAHRAVFSVPEIAKHRK